jgi:hypothetical protein
MLVMVLPSQLVYDVMSLASHAHDGAAEVTWSWHYR